MPQHIKMAGFAGQRRLSRSVQVCVFLVSRASLRASLVNGIKINVLSIIVFVLVFELRVNIAFVS